MPLLRLRLRPICGAAREVRVATYKRLHKFIAGLRRNYTAPTPPATQDNWSHVDTYEHFESMAEASTLQLYTESLAQKLVRCVLSSPCHAGTAHQPQLENCPGGTSAGKGSVTFPQPAPGHTSAVARNCGKRGARLCVKGRLALAARRAQRSVQALRERSQQPAAAALATPTAGRRIHCLRQAGP